MRVNRQRTDKPSQALRPGDVVTVTVRGHVRVLRMLAPGDRRRPPAEARLLFEELTEPRLPAATSKGSPASALPQRTPGSGRPTKRDRRQIDRLRDVDD